MISVFHFKSNFADYISMKETYEQLGCCVGDIGVEHSVCTLSDVTWFSSSIVDILKYCAVVFLPYVKNYKLNVGLEFTIINF